MKKRILSLLLAFLMLFSTLPINSSYAAESESGVTVHYFNPVSEALEEAGTVEMYRGGELFLSAMLRADVYGDIQWQIEVWQDYWVDIQGCTSEELRVSYGMVQSLLNNNTVRMRCVVYGDTEYCSEAFTLVVSDVDNRVVADTFNIERIPTAPLPLAAPIAVSNHGSENTPEFTDEIESELDNEANSESADKTDSDYVEETDSESVDESESEPADETISEPVEETDSEPADETISEFVEETGIEPVVQESLVLDNTSSGASSSTASEELTYYTVTIEYVYTDDIDADGNHLSKFHGQRVALPYIAEVAAGDTLNETVTSPTCIGYSTDITSINLADFDGINQNISLTVEYSPAEVSYTVRHYLQNVDNDEYTWVDTTMSTGYTEALTSDNAANTYTGFTALSHYHEEIAADSSTMIDIYYDRNYHLMSFNLDGGYGVSPIYARYGASIYAETPHKAGYSFAGWTTGSNPDRKSTRLNSSHD